jgi:hypothetical protein
MFDFTALATVIERYIEEGMVIIYHTPLLRNLYWKGQGEICFLKTRPYMEVAANDAG